MALHPRLSNKISAVKAYQTATDSQLDKILDFVEKAAKQGKLSVKVNIEGELRASTMEDLVALKYKVESGLNSLTISWNIE